MARSSCPFPSPSGVGSLDRRGGRVLFLSHCLLNQNTRYPGGAVAGGVVSDAVISPMQEGVGIVQMPCPEQRVWGGVRKRHLLWALDHPRITGIGVVLMPLIRRYLRVRYRLLARRVAKEVEDYLRSGLEPLAVVGVAGSPSCGVESTLDLTKAGCAIRARPPGPLTAHWMHDVVVGAATGPGRGVFVEELVRELRRRDLDVPLWEHELSELPLDVPGGSS